MNLPRFCGEMRVWDQARTGERWFVAELNRQKGELLLRQGRSDAAEELYRKALTIAEGQEAKLWELRAVVSLARLRRDQDYRTEARDLLWIGVWDRNYRPGLLR
jgi:predicted ATPase